MYAQNLLWCLAHRKSAICFSSSSLLAHNFLSEAGDSVAPSELKLLDDVEGISLMF